MLLVFADNPRNRTFFQSGGDKIVAVEALTFHREEEFACADGAGVNGISMSQFFARKIAGGGDEVCNF
jgi:hypothetical protein